MENRLEETVIVAYGRSPIAKAIKGTMKNVHPADFAAQVVNGVLKKVPQIELESIDDLIIGCSNPEQKNGFNMSRLIALRAGLPYSVPAQTVNRFCSSGLQTIAHGANAIMCGQAEIVVAGGCEMMCKELQIYDEEHKNQWLLENEKGAYMPMGLTAENVASKYGVTREKADSFSVNSHRRAVAARQAGKFVKEIIPIQGTDQDGKEFFFDEDECIRMDSSQEGLGKLKAAFLEGGVVTAGNSSQMSDGAAVVVLMKRERAESMGIRPVARFVGFKAAGVDPSYMGIGPLEAIPKVLKLTGLTLEQMDVIELNEAFATQAVACIEELGLDETKVNPNGGAVAMGHPLGATGAILTCKVLSELERTGGKYGMVTMCIGGGMGAAGIFEML